MNKIFRHLATGVLSAGLVLSAGTAMAQDTVKLAFIAPFSGPPAALGDAWLKMFNYSIGIINARGGVLGGKKLEIVTFDDKIQPAEALIQLKAATDQNISVVIGGIGSNVATAMIDGVAKHNARNPNKVVYMNISALSTELTEEKCDFWHFRFATNVTQRVLTMVKALPKDIKSVYVMNQDYLYGQGVYKDTKKFLAQYRPDVKIVGEEFIPLLKIKDFSSYIPKIKASGAQALLTSNWSQDFNLLMKAGNEGGLTLKYYSYSASLPGAPTAMGDGGGDRTITVVEGHDNLPSELKNAAAEAWIKGWRDTKPSSDYIWTNFNTAFEMLAAAINKAKSTDALKIALALEGMEMKDVYGNVNIMRKADHQIHMPMYAVEFVKGVKYESEGTGWGWRTMATVPTKDLTFPTECKMKRPKGA